MAQRLCLGRINGAHGVRGAVRVQSFTEKPEAIVKYGPLSDEAGTRIFKLKLIGQARGQFLAQIEGVADRNQAEALAGTLLYVDRAALPKAKRGEYYQADLIGMAVRGADGRDFGHVAAVYNFGAGDILELKLPDGSLVMTPFTADSMPKVDVAERRIEFVPPPGLFEPAEPPPAGIEDAATEDGIATADRPSGRGL